MSRRTWTEEEVNFLKENYGKLSNKKIALKLNRSVKSVENKFLRETNKVTTKVINKASSKQFQPVPKQRKFNLIPGRVYELNIKKSHSYDLTKIAGRSKVKKIMKFICETENLYVFEYESGLRECFSKYTPESELKIKLA